MYYSDSLIPGLLAVVGSWLIIEQILTAAVNISQLLRHDTLGDIDCIDVSALTLATLQRILCERTRDKTSEGRINYATQSTGSQIPQLLRHVTVVTVLSYKTWSTVTVMDAQKNFCRLIRLSVKLYVASSTSFCYVSLLR